MTNKEYEQIGRQIVNFYESGYFNKKETYKMTFVKGVLAGLGGVIGATIIVAAIVWALSFFHEVPLLGPFTEKVRHTINTEQKQ